MMIRPAVASDVEAIVQTFLACWRESYVDFLPADVREMYSVDSATEMWRRAPLEYVLVAETDRVVGVTRFGTGHIFSLYVHPAAQGLGAGKALLDAATARMREMGHDETTLWVFADNAAARAFYTKQGWHPDGGTRVEAAYRLPELRLRRSIGMGHL
jgi:ribosomal protein S18 acetylase RimI-like enzyme